MAAVTMMVLSNILGSSRTLSCCYNSNTSKEMSAKKMYIKKSRETCTDLFTGSCQDHVLSFGEQEELSHGLHCLLLLLPQPELSGCDQPQVVPGQEDVQLQGGNTALLLHGIISFAFLKNTLLPLKECLAAKGEECLVAKEEECLAAKREECLAALGMNALLLRKKFLSLAPLGTCTAWLPGGITQFGSLEDYSTWFLRGLLSLALKGLLSLALKKRTLSLAAHIKNKLHQVQEH